MFTLHTLEDILPISYPHMTSPHLLDPHDSLYVNMYIDIYVPHAPDSIILPTEVTIDLLPA